MDDRTFIELLDQKISRLKTEYEQYFIKAAKREPAKLRAEVDRMVLEYSDKNISNTSLKFRLTSIISRYSSYKQYWSRVLREIDEGIYVRRAEGADEGTLNSHGQPLQVPKDVSALKSALQEKPVKPAEVKHPDNGENEDKELREVYRKYIEVRKVCGERTDGVTFETLARTIEQSKKLVKSRYRTKDLVIRVDLKDGKARVVITPKKGGES